MSWASTGPLIEELLMATLSEELSTTSEEFATTSLEELLLSFSSEELVISALAFGIVVVPATVESSEEQAINAQRAKAV
jgi:hypothetical protein